MEEQPLDLRSTFKAIRRHGVLVLLLAAAGCGAGLAYGLRTTPLPEARALVLLPPSAITGNPGPSPYTQTQEIIASSTRVLTRAGASVYPTVSATTLKDHLAVSAPSQDVLQIAVSASTMRLAEHLADAVAASYISFVAGTANGSEQLLTQLQDESATLTHKILALQAQVDKAQSRLSALRPSSATRQAESSLLNSLTTQQEQLSIQLANVNTQVVNAELANAQATSATQLLQRAEPLSPSQARLPLIATLGGLAGLAAGSVLAISLAKGDRRLRSRDSIAAALGVPVVASMWAKRCKKVGQWRRLLEQCNEPSPTEAWNARRVLNRIGATSAASPVGLRLLTFSGDEQAAAASIKIAGAAAALGASVKLEVHSHDNLAPLRAACVTTGGQAALSEGLDLRPTASTSSELAKVTLRVRVEAVDKRNPKLDHLQFKTLLVVSSAFATATDLAKAALATADTGAPLIGVVVANPDPDDKTSGLLPAPIEATPPPPHRLNGHSAPELAQKEHS